MFKFDSFMLQLVSRWNWTSIVFIVLFVGLAMAARYESISSISIDWFLTANDNFLIFFATGGGRPRSGQRGARVDQAPGTEALRRPQGSLPSFTEFYRVLLGFTEFYRVLPSGTEFCWVLTRNETGPTKTKEERSRKERKRNETKKKKEAEAEKREK